MASTMEVINFTTEGRLSLEEVRFAIIDGEISSVLPCTRSIVYMNIRTMEEREFCIQLNREGFKVVGSKYDSIERDDTMVFETIYSLMESISPSYCERFSSKLSDKLQQLESQQKGEENK